MSGRRLRPAAAALAALLLTSAACTAGTDHDAREVTLAFGGDVHFEPAVARLLTSPGSAFGAAGAPLRAADLALVNLETPITGRGEPQAKRYVFRAPTKGAEELSAAGIDAVSLANNHSMDFGRTGLADTIAAVGAVRVGAFGAGRDVDEAFRPWRAEVRGVRIAVFGFSQVDDLAADWAAGPGRAGIALAADTDRAVRAVAAARADSDLVIVMPHGGTEGDPCPTRRQQEFARRMIEAGADIIVGAHAHVLQGAGRLGGGYVAYGLGNLLWYSPGLFPPFSARAGVLTLTVRDRTVVRSELTPTVRSGSGRPEVLTGWRAAMARQNFTDLRDCAGLEAVDYAARP
ncbi:CapA family protein [Actinoplanes sp. NPDC048796]|uniref:CapA family protein n=1 Tax=Actinoplanes sp. NPDC048796 TaxID=3155640 RepID=UPI0033C2CEB2